ncbi:MAG: NADH-quinone oxidoreductase subunit NuoH [Acidobacteriia bacterium]|nr:NADH-quinone oxidoreductase subunit NuoH [Terriglobia bacterium]
MSEFSSFLLGTTIKCIVVIAVLIGAVAYTTWLERKVVAHLQIRWGPSRVGWHGLLQPIADVLKLLLKEDMTPGQASKFLYVLAPLIAFVPAALSITVIPFGNVAHFGSQTVRFQITDLNVGILFIFAVTSVGVYGVALGGWASNNKYSLMGGLRSSAQMISYELSLGLSVVSVLLVTGTLSLGQIVDLQGGRWFGIIPKWNIFVFPLFISFFTYFVSAIAETNRLPFDLPEAENELVAGFHTEYSSMKFGMFFLTEYINMITVSAIATTLFFGGWHGPTFGPLWLRGILPLFWFVSKIVAFLLFYIWTRGTLPRFRYDQLMAFGWKFLVPLSLANVVLTSLVVAWRA